MRRLLVWIALLECSAMGWWTPVSWAAALPAQVVPPSQVLTTDAKEGEAPDELVSPTVPDNPLPPDTHPETTPADDAQAHVEAGSHTPAVQEASASPMVDVDAASQTTAAPSAAESPDNKTSVDVDGASGASPPPQDDSIDADHDPCGETSGEHWWDEAHQRFSRAVCAPSRWVDHFFINNNNASEMQVGSTALRVTQLVTRRDDHHNVAPVIVHASVDLPNLEQRFKLMFVNDDDVLEDSHSTSAELSGEQATRTPHGFRSAVRWGIRQSRRINLDWDIGLRSELHAWSQVRYRWQKPTSEQGWVKFTQRVFFRDPEGFGSDSLGEYNYNLSTRSSLNFYLDALLTEKNREAGHGWVISEGASWYYRVDERSAIQYSVGTYAWTEPGWSTQGYRAGIRYRRNFYRPWLFYEVEPFWEWPKTQDWGTVTGINLRLEMQFGYSRRTRL